MNELDAREAIIEGAPIGAVEPEGKPITVIMLRGTGPVLVDEDFDQFTARFSAFLDAEQSRGALFHFTTFYSWEVEVNKLHTRHVKTEPAALTLDGCQAVDEITPDYIKLRPIERREPATIAPASALPFPLHGPGKRR